MDKAINADSENAPKQLRVILLTENPQWKLPERRVARYLKRHLRARKNPIAEQIEADMDEETVYTMTESIVNARNEDGSFRDSIRDSIRNLTTDAYADENEVTGSSTANGKPLFCDECTCVIS